MSSKTLTRRDFVKGTGGLLIGFSLADSAVLPRLLAETATASAESPSPARLDAWLRIEPDGMIQVFTGKVEIGMGVKTGLTQIVAEELDVAPSRVALVMGDTSMTADQGGVGGSNSIMWGAKPLRNVGASARSLLLQLASPKLGAPVEQLEIHDGVISVTGHPSKKISYGDLAGGTDLNEALKVSGDGFGLDVVGAGKPKDPSTYKVVGKSLPRVDIRPKVLGQFQYVGDIKVPGMVHARVVRPPSVGANLVSADENSVKGIPGYVKTVVVGNFVGVVAQTEWAALQAHKSLKATWSTPEPAFCVQTDLYKHMSSIAPKVSKETVKKGDAALALSGAAKTVKATYEFPFQSHATMGPGCAIADVHMDGLTTVWSGAQKPHALRAGLADMLGVPVEKLRVIWMEDAGSYGRAGYEDTAADAVLLSREIGKPVRVQWSRADMTMWGPKAPAVSCEITAGLDAQERVTCLQFTSHAFSGAEILPQPNSAGNFLAAQLTGVANTKTRDEFVEWGEMAIGYEIENIYANAHIVPPFVDKSSTLRTTHLRDPEGPAATFAIESFVDELAAAANADPIEFRLRYIDDKRVKDVLTQASKKFGWDSRPSPKKNSGDEEIATGRGVAIGIRGGTHVATMAEVAVNRRTGAVRVKRFVCAHDCGLIINPEAVRGTVEANLVQSLSRSLKEEVVFDRGNVTSADWRTYPVARASNIPMQVDVILIDHPEIPPSGAGEPSTRPTAAAINNAIFDAVGVRLRQAPFTPARVKAALAAPDSASRA
jgi:CO/xanthine dehydrogenase Mo-binding subunit